MKKISFIAIVLICVLISLEAQNEMQALRYSQYNPFGTARYAAQAGATGAIGGDFSSVVVNPAGLGFYRSSEFTLSPSFYWANSTSSFMGSSVSDSKLKFNMGNLGYVQSITHDRSNGLVSVVYALGYSTLVDFNNRTTVKGINTSSSLLDDFTWHANADPDNLSPFYEQLAFDTYLMPYDESANEYWHDMQLDGYGQELHRMSEQSGYIGEYSIAGALNISNLLYMGATVGLHTVRFYEEIYHTETDLDDHVIDFDGFRFREYNDTKGWGYTFRMGLIVRPIQLFRVGASFQLPTFYRLTDEKYTDMNSYWDNSSGIADANASSPNGIYDYQLRTPLRANAHAALILFKFATVSAGYDYVNYSSARLDASDYKFMDENDQVRNDFRATHNLSAGAELRLKALYLRGGMKYMMSPFVDTRNITESWIYSAGFGFRGQRTSFDMSYSHSNYSEVYGMYGYQPGSNEVSLNEIDGSKMIFTLGFKF